MLPQDVGDRHPAFRVESRLSRFTDFRFPHDTDPCPEQSTEHCQLDRDTYTLTIARITLLDLSMFLLLYNVARGP